MNNDNDLYLATINTLVCIYVYQPPPIEFFIGGGRGFYFLDDEPISTHIYKTSLSMYYYRSDLTRENLQNVFKGGGDVRDGNDSKMFPSLFC